MQWIKNDEQKLKQKKNNGEYDWRLEIVRGNNNQDM